MAWRKKLNAKGALLLLVAQLVMLVGLSISSSAWAFPKSTTKDAVEGDCNDKGGVFTDSNGVYACLYPDGSFIICGGGVAACTTSAIQTGGVPGPANLPPDILNFVNTAHMEYQLDNLTSQVNSLQNQINTLQEGINQLLTIE